jgi:hypothetical protein
VKHVSQHDSDSSDRKRRYLRDTCDELVQASRAELELAETQAEQRKKRPCDEAHSDVNIRAAQYLDWDAPEAPLLDENTSQGSRLKQRIRLD